MEPRTETFDEWMDDAEEAQEELRENAERGLQRATDVVRALPYAWLGSLQVGFEQTRDALRGTWELPTRTLRSLRGMPRELAESFEDRADRGRRMIDRVRRRNATSDAAEQVRTTRAKVKGVATSAQRTARKAALAAEEAAEAAFDPQDTRPYEERTFVELRELASERDIAGRSNMNKRQLIKALRADR